MSSSGIKMQAIIFLKINEKDAPSLVSDIKKNKNVEEIFILEENLIFVMGSFIDIEELSEFLRNLRSMKGIENTETKLVLKRFKTTFPY
ncbi:MAG: Lrp/AsnC family transcriptional regulator [Candidatus Brockarchaeota archaeon]|nr:Lrp/AsnC family transcriptional regulator [Candidatus Brockarchaeota archaeon]MBO3801641.1 Lrp/AsnC family transcriptional regulator [Candidatus Brockarchaeota archaeon]